MENLSISISRRNVQHRLVLLVKKGLVHAEGKARARLYKLPPKEEKNMQGRFDAYNAYAISLSSEAEEIQRQVIRPIQARTPVGYNVQFFDEYHPNVTYYLSEFIRQRLFEMGKRMMSNLLEHMLERFVDVFLLIYHGIQVAWKAILILYWRQSVFLN